VLSRSESRRLTAPGFEPGRAILEIAALAI
jgi:hypothetical protein